MVIGNFDGPMSVGDPFGELTRRPLHPAGDTDAFIARFVWPEGEPSP